MRRGTKCAAAHHFRMILANDHRVRTMHTVAARTDRQLLPAIVADLLDHNQQRRQTRRDHAAPQRVSVCIRSAVRENEPGVASEF